MNSTTGKRNRTDHVELSELNDFMRAPESEGAPLVSSVRRKIRLLVFTSLYPNVAQPRHGVFVEERLRHLVDSGRVSATVVAPVPWFPFRHKRFGEYAKFARVPRHEERHGIQVLHPRYPVIPKLGMSVASTLMFRALLPFLRKLLAKKDSYDLIDAHYFYPDGVAAVKLGAALNKPVVITVRGSDVIVIAKYRLPARQIKWAAKRAPAIMTVSEALKCKVLAMGVDPQKVVTLRNGVDLDLFSPSCEREAVREELSVSGKVWLTVGHLIPRKGVDIAIQALAQFPDVSLLIVGDGPEEPKLRRLTEQLGLDGRVRFLGAIPHDALGKHYNAADALIHAASHEGMPNVVLESLACGTPVVAAPFDGVTELLSAPDAGEIATHRNADAIASAWLRLDERAPTRTATRHHAEQLGWGPVVDAQANLYASVLGHFDLILQSGTKA